MITRHPRHPNHLSQDPDLISQTFLEQFAPVLFTPSLLSTKFYKICMIHNNKLQNMIQNHNLQRSCLEFSKSCPEHKFGKMFFGSKISKRKSPEQQFVISFFFAGFSICQKSWARDYVLNMGLVQTVLVQVGSVSHGRKPPHLEQQQRYQRERNQQRAELKPKICRNVTTRTSFLN